MYDNLKRQLCKLYQRLAATGADYGNGGIITLFDAERNCYAVPSNSVRRGCITEDTILILDRESCILDGRDLEFDKRFHTHFEIYKAFASVRSVVQMDSRWCGIWASLGGPIPPLSALHGEYFFGEIPCTRSIEDTTDLDNLYVRTGKRVVEAAGNKAEGHVQGALIRNIGPIAWGATPELAIENILALEEIAFRAWHVRSIKGGQCVYLPYALSKTLFFEDEENVHEHVSFSGEQFSEGNI